MVNELHKQLRAIRIEHDELMYDMAKKLGMRPAELSAIEHGKKRVPDGFMEKIKSLYQ